MIITKPTLILSEEIARSNIKKMAIKVAESEVTLRPHFKTHQSLEIGRWFKDQGIKAITVSSIEMAEYFSSEWNDITIAFPVNVLEYARLNRLASVIQLGVLISDPDSVPILNTQLEYPVKAWIEVDTGDGRSGIPWNEEAAIVTVANSINDCENLKLEGLLNHSGHTYEASSMDEIKSIFSQGIDRLNQLKNVFEENGITGLKLSSGDTPGCSLADSFEGLDELRPGNFVYYDLMQHKLGTCDLQDIALIILAPVVAVYPKDNKVILHVGAVHLSKDRLQHDAVDTYGSVHHLTNDSWFSDEPIGQLTSLSQEHGVVSVNSEFISNIKIGDVLAVIPIHSCLSADLMGDYLTLEGRSISSMRSR